MPTWRSRLPASATESDRESATLADRVRSACAWVAERADAVRIAGDPTDYARRLIGESPGGAFDVEWDTSTHYSGGEPETLAFVVTLDSINFGSGYFPQLIKRPGRSGYFTIAISLKERFDRYGPYSSSELRQLTPSSVADLFGQPAGDPIRDELMAHFARALNDLGSFLEEHFAGSFERLVDSASQSAERLARLLTEMPYFRDVASYRGHEIPLYKRAQITPSDLALALPESARCRFEDLDRLTIFADNLVPHVLRLDGVLEYAEPLVDRLEKGEQLPAGSPEEVEIRAVALHTVELMASGLRALGQETSPRQLDLLLWNRGQDSRYRGGSKHRTRTVFY